MGGGKSEAGYTTVIAHPAYGHAFRARFVHRKEVLLGLVLARHRSPDFGLYQ